MTGRFSLGLQIGLLDAGTGTVTVLSTQVLPFAFTGAAPLHAGANGSRLACRLTDPANAAESLEVSALDATLASGSTGFVTNGESADFTFARICGE